MEDFMNMKRKIFSAVLILAALSGVFAGGKKDAVSDDDYVIKIGYGIGPGLCSAPFFIAEELGYFTEEGLKYEHTMIDIGQIPLLLTNGTIDVTNNLLAGMVQPIANGLDIKIPLAMHTGCIKVLVRSDSGITKPEDLKGKKIGISGMGAPGTIIAQRYLAEKGISTVTPNLEVDWIIYPAPELLISLRQKLVDAIVIGEPAATIAENAEDVRVIINTTTDASMKDEFCCVVVANSAIAKNHPAVLAKVVRAVQKASQYVQDHPEETAKLVAEKNYVAGDPAVNAEVLKQFNYRASVSESRAAISRNARDMQRLGLLDSSLDIDRFTNSVFLELPGVPDSLY
jgi:NitT/TauT family transport system substrate-binding protein